MRQWNKDALLVPMHVVPDKLDTVINGLRHAENLAGFAVTVPHKSAVLGLCDEASARAHAVGALNVVRREADGRLVGEIFDGVQPPLERRFEAGDWPVREFNWKNSIIARSVADI